MDNFIAIDFETANSSPTSVCSVGLVFAEDGIIKNSMYRLIHPEPDYYSYFNTQIHGLTKADTDNADIFPVVWKEIAPLIGDLPFVAHNSPFDEGCLKAVFRTYQMDYPDYPFYCTCRAARKVFGKQLPNHRLPTVAARCGYDLTKHHNALADAEACAAIAIKIL